MPKIQITFWNRKTIESKWSEIIRILSIMFFPKEQDQQKERNEFVSCFLASQILNSNRLEECLKQVSQSKDHAPLELLIRTLLHSPAFSDLEDKIATIFNRANIAGEILVGIFQFNKTLPDKQIGVKKSSFFRSKYGEYQTQIKMRGGKKTQVPKRKVRKLSSSTIQNYWEEFKSVAHFYAALRFFHGTRGKIKFNPKLLTPDNLLDFIAISRKIGDFGINYVPIQGEQKPIISKKELWTIDTNFHLPNIELKFSRPPRWVKKALTEYKAPRSKS